MIRESVCEDGGEFFKASGEGMHARAVGMGFPYPHFLVPECIKNATRLHWRGEA